MARIRTVKPEFFTSEDIVILSPLARLLYIAIWCEADKEGRLVWKPVTFKLRYFPGDNCDIQAMCKEIVDAGLVMLYGEGFAVIPSFKAHQHINPRESESNLPEPVAITTRKPRVTTRQPREKDAQGGREGKGKEGNDLGADAKKKRSSVPADFKPEGAGLQAALDAGLNVDAEVRRFIDHHEAKGSVMASWPAAWRTWVGNAITFGRGKPPPSMPGDTSWLAPTGFANIAEAQNARCHIGNAHQFRNGQRVEAHA